MPVSPIQRQFLRSASVALLIGVVLLSGSWIGVSAAASQLTPALTPGPTATPTTDVVQIITGGNEAANASALLRRFGIPLGTGAVALMLLFFVLRAVGKENLDTLAKRLNVVGWTFGALDRRRNRRSLDAGSLRYLKWLEGKYGRLQPLGIGTSNVDLDLDKVYVPLHTVEQMEIEQYYRRMHGEHAKFVANGTVAEGTDFMVESIETDREPLDIFTQRMGRLGRRQPTQIFTLLSDPAILAAPKANTRRRSGRTAQREEEEPQPVTTTKLLLLGDAGSGKTTTLCYAALQLAQAFRSGKAAALREGLGLYLVRPPFPIYVRLTLFSKWLPSDLERLSPEERQDFLGAKPVLFLRWLDDEVADLCDAPAGTLSAHVKNGRALLLLDGLDEAGDEDRRAHLARIIANLAAGYPDNRYLVASRPAGYGRRVQLGSFLLRNLRPLDPSEARELIRKWFLAVEARLAEAGLARQQQESAGDQTARLWAGIERSDRLLDMATNPLLVTAMALLQFNNVRLPDQRAKLYDKLVELLIDIWRRKQVDEEGLQRSVPELAADRGRVELLALEMQQQEEQVREVSLTQAQAWLAPVYMARLPIDRDDANARVQQLLESLALHSGLIQQRDGSYSFAHYTFQEYMAARALDGVAQRSGDQAAIDFLLERSDKPRWHETLLLAAGHWSGDPHTAPRSERLVCELLARHTQAADLLAAEALADIGPSEELNHLRCEAAQQLHSLAFANPPICPDAPTRNRAATLLDRLDADDRPALDLLHPDYWAAPIPPGPFLIGDDNSRYDDEKPAFVCTIARPYALARFPVTSRQYLQFLQALPPAEAERYRPDGWPGSRYRVGEGNHPVVTISWHAANAFAIWVNDLLRRKGLLGPGERVALPSEPEWERAAAYPVALPAGDPAAGRRTYPWGEWPEAEQGTNPQARANYLGVGIGGTSVAGIFPHGAADCGAEDLADNGWEWTRSIYAPYPYDPADGREAPDDPAGKLFTFRAGSWGDRPITLRAANRDYNNPDNFNDNVGFRLATHPACPAKCHAVRHGVVPPNTKKGASFDPGRGPGPAKENCAAPGPVVPHGAKIRARRNRQFAGQMIIRPRPFVSPAL